MPSRLRESPRGPASERRRQAGRAQTILMLEPSVTLRTMLSRTCGEHGLAVYAVEEVGAALTAVGRSKAPAVFRDPFPRR